MNVFTLVCSQCDVLLQLNQDEDSVIVAANETGRAAFGQLFETPVIWDIAPWLDISALPGDWLAISVAIGDLRMSDSRHLLKMLDEHKTTPGRDYVLSIGYELARKCRVILFQDGEFMAIRIDEVLH
jgi:hypothetical protein